MFPMTVRKVSLNHRGDTKAYHLVLITTSDDRGVVINRWGKIKAWGSVKVEPFPTQLEAQQAFHAKFDDKWDRGYTDDKIDNSKVVQTIEQLIDYLGPYWVHFGKDNAEWLVPGCDTSQITAPKEQKFRKVGNRFVEEKTPPRLVPDPPPLTAEEEAAKNPDWGIF